MGVSILRCKHENIVNWIVRIWMLIFCLILQRCVWFCEFGRFVSSLLEFWLLDLFTMFDRLPYIVGGQSIKRVIILQNHYSIQDLLLEALLASLVLEELFSFQLRFIKWNPWWGWLFLLIACLLFMSSVSNHIHCLRLLESILHDLIVQND